LSPVLGLADLLLLLGILSALFGQSLLVSGIEAGLSVQVVHTIGIMHFGGMALTWYHLLR